MLFSQPQRCPYGCKRNHSPFKRQSLLDFILFLNAVEGKGGYELMLSNKINNSLGLKGSGSPIEIYAQDGLPRWTASSVK